MNETPERICEALEWLYGVEFDFEDDVSYLEKTAYIFDPKGVASVNGQRLTIFVRDDGGATAAWPYRRREDITANLAHALAVTAPWEWTGRYARVPSLSVESVCFRVGPDDTTENDRFTWMLSLANGPTMQDSEFTEDAAKTAARTAYLTWMRGRFAMKGGVV